MTDDYLWDGSGQPDPEVERLEALLHRYRHEGGRPIPVRRFGRPRTLGAAFAIAAVLLLATVAVWMARRGSETGWQVVSLEGSPRIGGGRSSGGRGLAVGEWVETDGASRAEIRIGSIGTAQIDPNTRVQLVKAAATDHRLALARGTLHAMIWAPPRLFFVETPSAVAVDLGCAYTLSVDEGGAGLLRVESGWVAFELDGKESFVPAGAACATRPHVGPGTPYFTDASPAFTSALAHLDFGSAVAPALSTGATAEGGVRARALAVILDEARRRDAVTLWHLLPRTHGDERRRVFERLEAIVAHPEGVTREGVLGGDQEMIDRWWDELGLGVTTWWRLWKSPRPPGSDLARDPK